MTTDYIIIIIDPLTRIKIKFYVFRSELFILEKNIFYLFKKK